MANKRALNRGYGINLLLFVILVFGIRSWQQRDMVSGVVLRGMTLTGVPQPPLHVGAFLGKLVSDMSC